MASQKSSAQNKARRNIATCYLYSLLVPLNEGEIATRENQKPAARATVNKFKKNLNSKFTQKRRNSNNLHYIIISLRKKSKRD